MSIENAVTKYPTEYAAAHRAAEANYARILDRAPWVQQSLLQREVERIVTGNSALRIRLAHIAALATRFADEIAPFTPCRRGCDSCCHQAVAITSKEAQTIGENTGRPMAAVPSLTDEGCAKRLKANISAFFGKRCPFLRDHECTVYSVRPLSCRLHHTINDSAFFCSAAIAPTESVVAKINTIAIDLGTLAINGALGGTIADIREFFPE